MNYKRWIFIAIFLFGVGLIFGLATPADLANLISQEIATLEEFGDTVASLPLPLVAILIFAKNASALAISFVLSPILCLAPILSLTLNGWLISFVSTTVIQEKSLSFLLAGLLPHGIFEIPALIMAQAAALSFGAMAVMAIFKKEKRKLLSPNFKQNLKYLLIALALLVPAAIIETYVTPSLLT